MFIPLVRAGFLAGLLSMPCLALAQSNLDSRCRAGANQLLGTDWTKSVSDNMARLFGEPSSGNRKNGAIPIVPNMMLDVDAVSVRGSTVFCLGTFLAEVAIPTNLPSAEAALATPGMMDRVSDFFAENPQGATLFEYARKSFAPAKLVKIEGTLGDFWKYLRLDAQPNGAPTIDRFQQRITLNYGVVGGEGNERIVHTDPLTEMMDFEQVTSPNSPERQTQDKEKKADVLLALTRAYLNRSPQEIDAWSRRRTQEQAQVRELDARRAAAIRTQVASAHQQEDARRKNADEADRQSRAQFPPLSPRDQKALSEDVGRRIENCLPNYDGDAMGLQVKLELDPSRNLISEPYIAPVDGRDISLQKIDQIRQAIKKCMPLEIKPKYIGHYYIWRRLNIRL